ncbi:hypothetical protein [Opitutus sp. ER46]|uniref:hypothetical protein n=1 Tax=Opitutus sp. ER46 TaxID=2161864 RepID=UPI000D31C8B5|nr:hypothetical protein [Opitutus sp. ER46]PTX91634.1 hypothetical protein DB354_17335 [Opitutus sp. ER46]
MVRSLRSFLTVLVFAVAATSSFGFDASRLADAVRKADVVEVDHFDGRKIQVIRVTDAAWQERLAQTLNHGDYRRQPDCLCNAPQVRLLREGKILATFSVHHGKMVRVCIGSGLTHDYQVGEEVGGALEKRLAEKLPPPAAASGRDSQPQGS